MSNEKIEPIAEFPLELTVRQVTLMDGIRFGLRTSWFETAESETPRVEILIATGSPNLLVHTDKHYYAMDVSPLLTAIIERLRQEQP